MFLFAEKTEAILRCFYKVYNYLGYGFLEKVYENALLIELRKLDFKCYQQLPLKVYYESYEVGFYFADLIIDDQIIIELKAGKGEIIEQHELQLLNYLKTCRYEVGLILHFGKKPGFKRKIFTNDRK